MSAVRRSRSAVLCGGHRPPLQSPNGPPPPLCTQSGSKLPHSNTLRFAEVDHHRPGSEAARLDGDDHEAADEPDRPDPHRLLRQAYPESEAEGESQQRRHDIRQKALLPVASAGDIELPERRQVDTHESDQRAGVEDFAPDLVTLPPAVQDEGGAERHQANGGNAEVRRAAARVDVGEQAAWQHAVAAHAEEDASCADLAGEPAAEAGNDQEDPHGVIEQGATHAAAHVHEGGLGLEEVELRPDKLSEVSLKSAEEGCNHDHKHDGEQEVAPGIVNVLSEGCEPVEAD